MLVTERMRSLGDHAKSSRQPPVKERKYAKADESAAKQDVLDENSPENPAADQSALAVLVDDVTPQIGASENGNDGATEAGPVQEDDDASTAKRAIIHEWENWSALHSDELSDPNVGEYFLRHLETKKPHLLNSGCKDIRSIVRLKA